VVENTLRSSSSAPTNAQDQQGSHGLPAQQGPQDAHSLPSPQGSYSLPAQQGPQDAHSLPSPQGSHSLPAQQGPQDAHSLSGPHSPSAQQGPQDAGPQDDQHSLPAQQGPQDAGPQDDQLSLPAQQGPQDVHSLPGPQDAQSLSAQQGQQDVQSLTGPQAPGTGDGAGELPRLVASRSGAILAGAASSRVTGEMEVKASGKSPRDAARRGSPASFAIDPSLLAGTPEKPEPAKPQPAKPQPAIPVPPPAEEARAARRPSGSFSALESEFFEREADLYKVEKAESFADLDGDDGRGKPGGPRRAPGTPPKR
jgi:hypothetical protein